MGYWAIGLGGTELVLMFVMLLIMASSQINTFLNKPPDIQISSRKTHTGEKP